LIVFRFAQEFFTNMEMSPLPLKGCKIQAYARRNLGLWSALRAFEQGGISIVPKEFSIDMESSPFPMKGCKI
jgi:hypothetical protein